MSVFPFPDVSPSEVTWSLVSNTGVFQSPLTGATQTNDRGGERWRVRLTFRNLNGADRARLQAFLVSLNGQQHRFTLHDHSYSKRGAISVSEMLDVPFDATNWQTSSSVPDRGSISDLDDGVRFVVGHDTAITLLEPTTQADGISSQTTGRSYAATLSVLDGRKAPDGGSAPDVSLHFRTSTFGSIFTPKAAVSTAQRLVTQATASGSSSLYLRPSMNDGSGGEVRASLDCARLSCARALLVDNGFNALLRSEEFDNASWIKGQATVDNQSSVAPDGTTTADELIEDSTAASTHFIAQTSTRTSKAEVWTGSVFAKQGHGSGTRIMLRVDDGNTSNEGHAIFDCSNGTITLAATQGGTAANAYATIHAYTDGWYRCRISVLLAATTSVRITVFLCDGATNTTTFNGDGTSGMHLWGAQLQRGGQLGRYTPTTTAAVTGTNQTGNRIWLKGLDADTAGQLLPGDRMEINGQVVMLTSQLDGDESGVGLAEVRPRIRSAPSDEAAVVLLKPSGKFILADPEVSWSNVPGIFSDFSFDCIEDIA